MSMHMYLHVWICFCDCQALWVNFVVLYKLSWNEMGMEHAVHPQGDLRRYMGESCCTSKHMHPFLSMIRLE